MAKMAIMKFVVLLVGAWLTGLAVSAPTALPTFSQADIDSGKALQQLGKIAYDTAMARVAKSTSGCTKDNVKIRKEWRNMTLPDRKAYQEAVQCLMQKPSRNKAADAPGAKTAWDDYGVLHYYQTPYVHNSATFLLWHRHYNWILEEDLRNLCGYKGVFPYWEWGLDCGDIEKSPVFDGSEYSLGGNGEFVKGHYSSVGGAKAGTGGGCLKKGTPFANFTVNLGPVGSANPLKYNPRCIKRDLNADICKRWASLRNTTDPLLNSANIEIFQDVIQGDGRVAQGARAGIAVHGGGHYTISGDPGSDFYFSALEPGFYLHHGNIDRLHFIWQNLDWSNRQTISGTNTMFNQPPTPEAKLGDPMAFEPINRNITIQQAMDTVGGVPLCYVYEPW